MQLETAGGGGRGSPLERDVELVRDDLIDGKVSRQAAVEIYGVVLTADGRDIDTAATAAERVELHRRLRT
jgi:N-methylhydantoinase B